jgi:hypothetical protein
MIYCGFKLPMTPFQMEVLKALGISPCQLHCNSWWMLVTLEAWFRRNKEFLGTDRPTTNVLWHFFQISKVDVDWLSMKNRHPGTKLIRGDAEPKFRKADRWNHRFYFLANPSSYPECQGGTFNWRPLPKTFKSPVARGDRALIEKIEALISRKKIYYAKFFNT